MSTSTNQEVFKTWRLSLKEMENSKFKADSIEEIEGKDVPKEETGNNSDNAEKECIESFLKVEDSLNDLFSDVVERKSQLHCDMEKLQTKLAELIKTKDKVADLRIKDLEYLLGQYIAENSKLKSEVDELKEQIRRSDFRVCELKENLEICQQKHEEILQQLKSEDIDSGSPISSSWVDIVSNKDNDTFTWQRTKSSDKSDEAELDPGQDELRNENEKVAERRDYIKDHRKEIELMNDWYNFKYTDINASLMQEKVIDHLTIKDVLSSTLWEAYRFSIDMMNKQLKAFSINLYLPHSAEQNPAELELPRGIVHKLKELMLKVEPIDMNRLFKEKLMESLNAKIVGYLNEHPKFILYISDCLRLCRMLLLNKKCLSLDFHAFGVSVNKESFNIYSSSEQGVVDRVLFPALICFKGKGLLTLRKGLVTIKPTE